MTIVLWIVFHGHFTYEESDNTIHMNKRNIMMTDDLHVPVTSVYFSTVYTCVVDERNQKQNTIIDILLHMSIECDYRLKVDSTHSFFKHK